jgi:hypothetical protein
MQVARTIKIAVTFESEMWLVPIRCYQHPPAAASPQPRFPPRRLGRWAAAIRLSRSVR